jgi:hypothetical protein
MALSSRPQRTNTQRDYVTMNLRFEDNIPDEDRYTDFAPTETSFSDIYDTIQTPDSDSILPSESASQSITPSPLSSLIKRPRKTTSKWLWDHFITTPIDQPWMNRAKKMILPDRLIRCKECKWETFDSVRSGSTSNLQYHLKQKHDIKAPSSESSSSTDKQLSITESLSKKPKLSTIAQLQENLLRWFIKDKVAFMTIESPSFRQIFTDLGHDEALFSRHTLKRRIEAEFQRQRLQLKTDLALTCKSIALSLDLWTSKNNISVIAIIGHWLTPEFVYKQKVSLSILRIIRYYAY